MIPILNELYPGRFFLPTRFGCIASTTFYIHLKPLLQPLTTSPTSLRPCRASNLFTVRRVSNRASDTVIHSICSLNDPLMVYFRCKQKVPTFQIQTIRHSVVEKSRWRFIIGLTQLMKGSNVSHTSSNPAKHVKGLSAMVLMAIEGAFDK